MLAHPLLSKENTDESDDSTGKFLHTQSRKPIG
jgi:hypothetical protein